MNLHGSEKYSIVKSCNLQQHQWNREMKFSVNQIDFSFQASVCRLTDVPFAMIVYCKSKCLWISVIVHKCIE